MEIFRKCWSWTKKDMFRIWSCFWFREKFDLWSSYDQLPRCFEHQVNYCVMWACIATAFIAPALDQNWALRQSGPMKVSQKACVLQVCFWKACPAFRVSVSHKNLPWFYSAIEPSFGATETLSIFTQDLWGDPTLTETLLPQLVQCGRTSRRRKSPGWPLSS